jgi:hypothetical protein
MFARSLLGHRNIINQANQLWNRRRGRRIPAQRGPVLIVLCYNSLSGDAIKLLEYAGIRPPLSSSDGVPMPAILADNMRLFWMLGIGGVPRDALHGVRLRCSSRLCPHCRVVTNV